MVGPVREIDHFDPFYLDIERFDVKTDLELLLSLARQDAPRSSLLAVADRAQARWRDRPDDPVTLWAHLLATAVVRASGPDADGDDFEMVERLWLMLRAALRDSSHTGGG